MTGRMQHLAGYAWQCCPAMLPFAARISYLQIPVGMGLRLLIFFLVHGIDLHPTYTLMCFHQQWNSAFDDIRRAELGLIFPSQDALVKIEQSMSLGQSATGIWLVNKSEAADGASCLGTVQAPNTSINDNEIRVTRMKMSAAAHLPAHV